MATPAATLPAAGEYGETGAWSWIVTVDHAGPVEYPTSSPSGVVAPDGSWAYQAEPQGEQFFAYTIPLEND